MTSPTSYSACLSSPEEWTFSHIKSFTPPIVISRESCGGYDLGELAVGQAASGLGSLDVIAGAGEDLALAVLVPQVR